MKRYKSFIQTFIILVFSLLHFTANSQLVQTVRGNIVDKESKSPVIGASVIVLETIPIMSNSSDEEGNFRIEKVPTGRYDIKVSCIGYEPVIVPEVLVTTGKEVVLNIEVKESITALNDVVITAKSKDKTQNSMSMISSRTFSVEEARRYAGGLDDPVRLASAFAGVSGGSIENNGIVIRGNSPRGVLWKLEGAEIPNPNHFGDGEILGGGFVCALSSQVLGNSDFLTGAFAPEYGNALSGVFDMKLRNGNNERREYAFQAGVLGLDFAAEGPFKTGKKSSFIANYRYSTFSLVKFMFKSLRDLPQYQDLTFKLNFPSKKLGTFSLWGFGGIDQIGMDAIKDSTKWEWGYSRMKFNHEFFFGAAGMSHKLLIGSSTYINSNITASYVGTEELAQKLDYNLLLYTTADTYSAKQQYSLSSYVNHKFNQRITNRTGFTLNNLQYDMDINFANEQKVLIPQADENGNSYLVQAFTQTKFDVSNRIVLTGGLYYHYFALNRKQSFEPRAACNIKIDQKSSLTFGYGNHSQTELLRYYFIKNITAGTTIYPNKNLGFAKANHYVISYDRNINDKLRIKIEPYYQYLYNVPVVNDSSFSVINVAMDSYFREPLVNKGTGMNYGIDFTLEKFLDKGYYYLLTGSLMQSKYKGGDNVTRNTRYNRTFMCNILGGKEWNLNGSANKIAGVNVRLYLMGGERYVPLKVGETELLQRNIYDYYNSFSKGYDPSYRFDFTITYRKNNPGYSGTFALQFLNVFGSPERNGFEYNFVDKKVKENTEVYVFPVLSYKVEF